MHELALFAGAGGGILGGELLGWRTVCAVERDAYAAAILAQRQMTESRGAELLMSFLAGFPVRTFQPPARVKGSPENDPVSGVKWHELLVKFDRDTHSWKTHRCLFQEDLQPCSVILPRWGMMRDGVCWGRITSEYQPRGRGYGFWPAAMASTCTGGMSRRALINTIESGGQLHVSHVMTLQGVGSLNFPTGYQWIMGWPIGWTKFEPLAMDKFQQWRNLHGRS